MLKARNYFKRYDLVNPNSISTNVKYEVLKLRPLVFENSKVKDGIYQLIQSNEAFKLEGQKLKNKIEIVTTSNYNDNFENTQITNVHVDYFGDCKVQQSVSKSSIESFNDTIVDIINMKTSQQLFSDKNSDQETFENKDI